MSGADRWTGGQYSLFRAAFGAYLFVHFASLLPWSSEIFSSAGALPDRHASPLIHLFPNLLALNDSPSLVWGMIAVAAVASLLFAVGYRDRPAALLIWYVAACLFGRNPLIANPSLPYVGWMLLAHLFVPRAPYGSWAARARLDPDAGFRMPVAVHRAAWIVMAAGYSYSGWTKLVSPSWIDGSALERVLANPLVRPGPVRDLLAALPGGLLQLLTWGGLALELGFAPLVIFKRVRPFVWLAMLAMHIALITLVDFADLSLGMVMLHLLTFDPGWVAGRRGEPAATVFYDGTCGLCHRAVRFVLAEDRDGERFRFSPLQGERARASLPEAQRLDLPDSMVLLAPDGRSLTRSAAVRRILIDLGGAWKLIGLLAGLVPRSMADRLYDVIARLRHRMFARAEDACPRIPPHLRGRFDL